MLFCIVIILIETATYAILEVNTCIFHIFVGIDMVDINKIFAVTFFQVDH